MIVGVPAEVKIAESRVAITPDGVRGLTSLGHRVLVETGAGAGSSMTDADFVAAGATRGRRGRRRGTPSWSAR